MVERTDGTWLEPAEERTFARVLSRRVSRAGVLKAGIVVAGLAATGPVLLRRPFGPAPVAAGGGAGALAFTAIQPSTEDRIIVADGHQSQVLLSWGDALFEGVPAFDLNSQTAALQAQRFGFNCDFVMFVPLPPGSGNASDGLLWVNHEYTDGAMMFPAYDAAAATQEQVDIELAAHGASIVRVVRQADGSWAVDPASEYNRRITATTPIRIAGPAAGDPRLVTADDPSGASVLGMLNNCGGGITPWGTILTAEENFNQYFANNALLTADAAAQADHDRYGIPDEASERGWERYYPRFDVSLTPHEPYRFGWIVEVDPYDPAFQPVKRTALGRMKHEAATVVVASDGRVVVYMGDDERFECVYKFVSDAAFDPANRDANLGLLDAGTLYAARFNDDGSGDWLPLVAGSGGLDASSGFAMQADVLIRTRQAAEAAGATKMDRPEDVETNPVNRKVYLVMTNNTQRGEEGRPGPDPANPIRGNKYGHIIELTEGGDPTATTFEWNIFMLCGDASYPGTVFPGFPASEVSPIANPDNITFDSRGNLWIATDGQPGTLEVNDAVHAIPTDGPDRGHLRQLLSAVPGAEVASLVFTPDDGALFVSIQHPGEGGTLAEPVSQWPSNPARPSVIVVTKSDGGAVGT